MEWTFFGPVFGPVVGLPLVAPFAGTLVWTGFWIWMLVDAIQRDESEYPGDTQNRKVLWVLAIAILHAAAVVYLFAVFAKGKRSVTSGEQATTMAPAPPSQDAA